MKKLIEVLVIIAIFTPIFLIGYLFGLEFDKIGF